MGPTENRADREQSRADSVHYLELLGVADVITDSEEQELSAKADALLWNQVTQNVKQMVK